MAPQLADLTGKDGDKVVVLKVNVDRQRALAQRAGVRSIPDTRLYFAGKQLERRVGGQNLTQLSQMVQRHAKKLPAPQGPEKQGIASTTSRKNPSRPSITPTSRPGKSSPGKAEDGVPKESMQGGTVVPMNDDWLPPGVTRK